MLGHVFAKRPEGVVFAGSLRHRNIAGTPRLAVMIATRDRPEELALCLASLGQVTRPAGVEVIWIVVDNASPPQEASIRAAAEAAGLEILYGHEPKRGYASPRNRALAIALDADADVLVFTDDDVIAERDVLVEHVQGLLATGADVSMGGQTGKAIGTGSRWRKMKVATFNVAFRRWLIDPPSGPGLRFDERLNLTGFEDHEFFYAAQERGAKVYRNGAARIGMRDSRASITQKSMPDDLLANYIYATGRNLSYVRRLRRGPVATALMSGSMLAARLGRLAFNLPLAAAARTLAPRIAARARRQALMDRAFVSGLADGLRRPGVERAAAKQGRIVEIVD